MNPDRWRQIEEVFQQALECADDERTGFVRRVTGDDSELRREVQSLLQAHASSSKVLDAPAHGGAVRLLDLDPELDLRDPVGARLGAYRITAVLGAGGMGAIYKAVRDDDAYKKEVAIKLVRRGLVGSSASRREELQRRFQNERQVLASLDHPYIARLIDAGTTDDNRPYFVMDYVEGVPIDAYCDRRELTVRDRLLLFLKVCDAVQHAHQNLVIHRDLKPGNILITEAGTPKLLDFGLAKLVDPRSEAIAAPATVSHEFMGTFAFAAPEQVADVGSAADIRTDVYALGMILYRLLSGAHPYGMHGTMTDVLHRITTLDPGPPSHHNRAIDDELDTIVLKALAKEQSRRYQTVGDLRTDIQRYLDGDAILAKADSGWYVLRKHIYRYRRPLAVAVIVALLVAGFAVFATVQATRLAEQRTALASALRVSNIERGRMNARTDALTLAEQFIWPQHLQQRDRRSHWALWEAYARQPCLRTVAFDQLSMQRPKVSPDGRLATYDEFSGRIAPILNLNSGVEQRTLESAHGMFTGLDFCHDSRRIISATVTGAVELWDLYTFDPPQLIHDYESDVRVHFCISHDDSMVACAGTFGLELRRVSDGGLVQRLTSEPVSLRTMRLSPDAKHLVCADTGNVFSIWDVSDGRLRKRIAASPRAKQAIAISADNRYLAIDVGATAVGVYELATLERVAVVDEPKGWITSTDFHPGKTDPWLMSITSMDKLALLVEVPSGRIINRFGGHRSAMNPARFTDDGALLVTAGRDGAIRFWECAAWKCESKWPQREGNVFNLRRSPDGSTLAACYGDSSHVLRLLDPDDGRVRRVLHGHTDIVSSVDYEPTGRYLASSSYDGTVRIWPLDDIAVTEPRTIRVSRTRANAVAISPDGHALAVVDDMVRVSVIDVRSGAVTRRYPFEGHRIPSVAWSPRDSHIAVALMMEPGVVLIDTETDAQRPMEGPVGRCRIVRFSPDGSLLAAGAEDGSVHLWPMSRASPVDGHRVLSGHKQDVFAIAFSPDGALLSTSGRGGVIRLWDVETGAELAQLPGHPDMVFTLAFNADGTKLISAGRDTMIRAWDLTYYDQHIAGNAAFQTARYSAP